MSRPGFSIRSRAVVALFVASMAFPQLAAAQAVSDEPSDADAPAAVVEADPVVDEVAPSESPEIAPAPTQPTWLTNAVYVGRIRGVESGWLRLEIGLKELASKKRLGTLPPSILTGSARGHSSALNALEGVLADSVPPPQFAHVHQLHLSAAAEIRAATESADDWLVSDSRASLSSAQAHLDRFDVLIDEAIIELG